MKIIASATIALAAVTAANAGVSFECQKSAAPNFAFVRDCDRLGTASYSARARAGARRICIVNLTKAAEALRA